MTGGAAGVNDRWCCGCGRQVVLRVWTTGGAVGVDDRWCSGCGQVVLWVWTTDSMVRRSHCRLKGQRTHAHTSIDIYSRNRT